MILEEAFVDAQNNIGTFFWNPDFETLREEYEPIQLPALMDMLEKLFMSNTANSGYWVGGRLSCVDFLAWHFLDCVRPFSQKTLDHFAALAVIKRQIESRPAIAAYLESGRCPKTLTVPVAHCSFGGHRKRARMAFPGKRRQFADMGQIHRIPRLFRLTRERLTGQ